MSGSSDAALLRSLIELELSLERESSESVEEFDWGRLIHNPKTDQIWIDNYMELDSDDVDAHELAVIADRELGGRGLAHRLIRPRGPERAAALETGFREIGWDIDLSLFMVLRREPDRTTSQSAEVPRDRIEIVRRAVAEDDPDFRSDPDFTGRAIRQSLARDARVDPIANARWFAAPANGEPGASCVLYERDGIGQVETVGTRPEFRGRGLATAVVMAAAEASRQAGHRTTFIVADAEDWPWKLYEKLGFDPVGEHRAFLRKPPQLRGGESP
jgi:GNAT superfamily N-acetyltransferase